MPTLKITGDARGAIKANLDLARAIDRVGTSATKTTAKLKTAEAGARAAGNAGVRGEQKHAASINATNAALTRKAAKLRQATIFTQGIGTSLRSIGSASARAFNPAAIGSTIAGYVGLQAAISAVRNELEENKRFQEGRAQTQLSLAIDEQLLRQNLFGFTRQEAQVVLDAIPKLAFKEGLPLGSLYRSGSTAISAGGETVSAVSALATAARFSRDPEQIPDIAAAIEDLRFSSDDISTSIQGLGALMNTLAYARNTSVGQLARRVGPVVATYTDPLIGSTTAEGLATYAAFTKSVNDAFGDVSRTTAINFPLEVEKFFRREWTSAQYDPDQIATHTQRFEELRNNKALAKEFITFIKGIDPGTGGAKFRAQGREAVSLLIQGDKDVVKVYEDVLSRNVSPQRMEDAAAKGIVRSRAGELQAFSRMSGGLEAAYESFKAATAAEIPQSGQQAIVDVATKATHGIFTASKLESFVKAGSSFKATEALDFINSAIKAGQKQRSNEIYSQRPWYEGHLGPPNRKDAEFLVKNWAAPGDEQYEALVALTRMADKLEEGIELRRKEKDYAEREKLYREQEASIQVEAKEQRAAALQVEMDQAEKLKRLVELAEQDQEGRKAEVAVRTPGRAE